MHKLIFYHTRAYGDSESAATGDKETHRRVVNLCFDFFTEFLYSKGKDNRFGSRDERRVKENAGLI
jgi:hypothetical protein